MDDDEDDDSRRVAAGSGRARRPSRRRARSSSGAWPSRARAGGRRPTSRSRSPERPPPGGWHRSPAGFLRRTLQAADENNIPFLASALTFDALLAAVPFILLLLIGLTHLAQALSRVRLSTPIAAVPPFCPRIRTGSRSVRLHRGDAGRNHQEPRAALVVCGPGFLWFSTRLFAGVRTSLNDIYDVSLAPTSPRRHFAGVPARREAARHGYGRRHVLLFLANTLLTTGLAIVASRGREQLPQFAFFVSTVGRILGELLAFSFSVSLFYVTYRYASVRRLPWRTALLASTFTAVLFEIAKRLYGLYLTNLANLEGPLGDANIGAAVLFMLWVFYTAIVFLLGGVVAETWELRAMQQRQRAILG